MVEAAWSWTLREDIPSNEQAGHEAIERLLVALSDAAWDGRDYFHVQMAVEEAVVNAVKHGNKENPNKIVELDFKVSSETTFLRIKDQGDGFSPDDLPDPRADENLESTNGRGVMLIREMMTEVEYKHGGREVVMVKRRQN